MISLALANQIGTEIGRRLVSDAALVELVPVGSVRRKEAHVKDLDFLLVVRAIPKTIALGLAAARGGVVRALLPRSKATAVRHVSSSVEIKAGFSAQVDFFVCTPKEKPFMLFHYTGSKAYNVRTRAFAKRKKWKLNQYGVYLFSGAPVRGSGLIRTEQDLVEFLGVTFRPPEDRAK